jgi:molecular chaperone GrpE
MNKKDTKFNGAAEPEAEQIPVNDKRRFNAEGEWVADSESGVQAEPQRSPNELLLEARLKTETDRREAAEAKLVGVQAKFEEAKAGLEKETAEMRLRLRKTLEAKATEEQFNFLTTLLPVLDNLNRAVAASEADPDIGHLRDGVIGTARSFEQALLSVGVQPIKCIGEDFDPEIHEAVDLAPSEEEGKVIQEYSRGYKFGERLLRAARVQVGRAALRQASE